MVLKQDMYDVFDISITHCCLSTTSAFKASLTSGGHLDTGGQSQGNGNGPMMGLEHESRTLNK